jgi:hypothetical protein
MTRRAVSQTMLEFINFKLYHSLGLAYPPRLSSAGDSAATGLMAVMHDVATGAGGLGLISAAPTEADPQSESAVASERRLGSLAEKLTQLKGTSLYRMPLRPRPYLPPTSGNLRPFFRLRVKWAERQERTDPTSEMS